MTPPAAARRGRAAVVLALAGAAYAGVASGTVPFSVAADIATAVPCAGLAAAVVLQRVVPGRGPWRRLDADHPTGDGTAIPWLAVIAVLVAVELASYVAGGSRAVHPTLSSGADALFRAQAAKAAAFFAWMVGGWYLVRR